MSGSLAPCIPLQFYLKFDPPKITLVYHFLKKENEQFYHDIPLTKKMLDTQSEDDVCSHLYVTEAYYLDPKRVKRQQVNIPFAKHLLILVTDFRINKEAEGRNQEPQITPLSPNQRKQDTSQQRLLVRLKSRKRVVRA